MERKQTIGVVKVWDEPSGSWMPHGYFTDLKAAARAMDGMDVYWVWSPIFVYG